MEKANPASRKDANRRKLTVSLPEDTYKSLRHHSIEIGRDVQDVIADLIDKECCRFTVVDTRDGLG